MPRATPSPLKRSRATYTKVVTVTVTENYAPLEISLVLQDVTLSGGVSSSPALPTSILTLTSGPQDEYQAGTVTRHSKYPEPSPPGFLYPEPIVPRGAYEYRKNLNTGMSTSGETRIRHSELIWYSHYRIELLLLLVILFLGLRAVVAWLITFLPLIWRVSTVQGKKQEDVHNANPHTSTPDHAESATTSSTDTPSILFHSPTTSIHSLGDQGLEIKYRPRHRHHKSISSNTTPSAQSPFLTPTHSHTHFTPSFSPSTPPHSSPSHSSTPSPTTLTFTHALNTALEAGTAPPPPTLTPTARNTHQHANEVYGHTKKGSWVDLSVVVESKVAGWVDRVARWTNDEGGRGEGEVLPLRN